jgi:DNA polymerase-4
MDGRLAALGIRTVGDLRTRTLSELEAAFGRYGRRLHDLALGIDGNAVTPDRPVQSISAEDTFQVDLPLAEVGPTITTLAEKVWAQVGKTDRIGRTVVLKLKTSDFRILTRSHTPPAPLQSATELLDIALALRERVALPATTRYRLVGVGLGNFRDADPGEAQCDLFSAEVAS